jgi:hypothetical protein
VVPARGVTKERFFWSKWFIKVDFPELGGPKMSKFIFVFSVVGSVLSGLGSNAIIFLVKGSKFFSVKAERKKKQSAPKTDLAEKFSSLASPSAWLKIKIRGQEYFLKIRLSERVFSSI